MQYSKEQQIGKRKKKKSRIVGRILPVDRAFSFLVRAERNWECEWCHKLYVPFHELVGYKWEEGNDCQNLGISHYWKRNRWETRFNRDNIDVLCTFPCHRHLGHGDGRQLYIDFKLKKLGQKKFDLLQILSQNSGHGKNVKGNQELFLMVFLQELKQKFDYQIDWFFEEYKLADWIIREVKKDGLIN